MNLCPICKSEHNETHYVVNFDLKNYLCNTHKDIFINYCETCKKDLCSLCKKDHFEHKIIYYSKNFPDLKRINLKMKELRETIDKLKANINKIFKNIKILFNNIETFYKINTIILDDYKNSKNKNFYSFYNIGIVSNFIDEETDNIKNKYNYGYNINQLLNVYNELIKEDTEIGYNNFNNININNFNNNNININNNFNPNPNMNFMGMDNPMGMNMMNNNQIQNNILIRVNNPKAENIFPIKGTSMLISCERINIIF